MENTEVTVTLTAAKWNIVLNALSQRPFGEVNTIISDIMSQGATQVKSAESSSTVHVTE